MSKEIYEAGMKRIKGTLEPEGQKFKIGSRVKIDDNLGDFMRHFPSGVFATVLYTYAHAYGGEDIQSYCLDVDGEGSVSWYYEWQLTAV